MHDRLLFPNQYSLLTDPGSKFTNSSYIQLGFLSHGNQLIVSNGAVAAADYTSVENNGGSLQQLILTGAGSRLTNRTDFYLGQSGSTNFLFLSDGATLFDNYGYIGFSSFSSYNNQALISGTNALWTNRSDLYVALSGIRNQLIISNAARVFNNNGYIGYNSDGAGNIVAVTGAGSLWTNRSALYVGREGSYNQLFVTNGGTVISPNSFLAYNSGSVSNRAVVAGPGSVWRTLTTLTVGNNLGAGNQLVISNAGTVIANNLTIGSTSVSSRTNSLLVSGGNLFVTNTLAEGYFCTMTLESGLIYAGSLNPSGGNALLFNFIGGTLQTRSTFAGFPSPAFVIGNGIAPATFEMLASGTHNFSGGLVVSSNAILKGVGTIKRQPS
jgi:T5SS/PEP-CTERM-associated repeat protein